MTPAAIGGLLGATFAFCGFVAVKVLLIYSGVLRAILFPGNMLIASTNGHGTFGHMMIDTVAYLGSVLLYGVVGFGIGSIFTSRRNVA